MCLELAADSVTVQHPAVRAGGQPSPVKSYQSVEQGVPCYELGYYRLFLEPKDLPSNKMFQEGLRSKFH